MARNDSRRQGIRRHLPNLSSNKKQQSKACWPIAAAADSRPQMGSDLNGLNHTATKNDSWKRLHPDSRGPPKQDGASSPMPNSHLCPGTSRSVSQEHLQITRNAQHHSLRPRHQIHIALLDSHDESTWDEISNVNSASPTDGWTNGTGQPQHRTNAQSSNQ